MLPATMHLDLARTCVTRGAHFVSSSYITPEMRALDAAAHEAGVSIVGEVGLDPGIDHLMAHDLVAAYRASKHYDRDNVLSFTSHCGGVPARPNAFRYKFSWSPLGVLRALMTPARSIRDYSELRVAHPWDAVQSYTAPLRQPEVFEVYPNRDSLPFREDYRFDRLVRGMVGHLRRIGHQPVRGAADGAVGRVVEGIPAGGGRGRPRGPLRLAQG
jgi:saccharopine dehydrogenase (NADP+, L-glutamate forming)